MCGVGKDVEGLPYVLLYFPTRDQRHGEGHQCKVAESEISE